MITFDEACMALSLALVLVVLAICLWPRRRATRQQRQLARVLEFPRPEDRVPFRSHRGG